MKENGLDKTVFSDTAQDTLTGSSDVDWFFAELESGGGRILDKNTDLKSGETATDED